MSIPSTDHGASLRAPAPPVCAEVLQSLSPLVAGRATQSAQVPHEWPRPKLANNNSPESPATTARPLRMQRWEPTFDFPRLSAQVAARTALDASTTQKRHHAHPRSRQSPLVVHIPAVSDAEASLPRQVVSALRDSSELFWALKKEVQDEVRRATRAPPHNNGPSVRAAERRAARAGARPLLQHRLGSAAHTVGGHRVSARPPRRPLDVPFPRNKVAEAGLKGAAAAMASQERVAASRQVRPRSELACVVKLQKAFDAAVFEAVQSHLAQRNARPVSYLAASARLGAPPNPANSAKASSPVRANASTGGRTQTLDEFWDTLVCRLPDYASARPRAGSGGGPSTQAFLPITASKLYTLLQTNLHDNNKSKARFQQLPPYCCVVPLFLDVPDVYALRQQFAELDPRNAQVGIDDCANAHVRPAPAWGDSVLSRLHASASSHPTHSALLGVLSTETSPGSTSGAPVSAGRDATGAGSGVAASAHRLEFVFKSSHTDVQFETRRRFDVGDVLNDHGAYLRRVRAYCRRGCLQGQRRRLWQLMLQCDSPQSQVDTLAAAEKDAQLAHLTPSRPPPPSTRGRVGRDAASARSACGADDRSQEAARFLELVTPGGSPAAPVAAAGGGSWQLTARSDPSSRVPEAHTHARGTDGGGDGGLAASGTTGGSGSSAHHVNTRDGGHSSMFTEVEGRYALGAAATPSRRERFQQLLLLWQEVEFCTDAWLEIDLQETANADAFFVFDSELRSIMCAVSRDASVRDQLAARIHSPIFADVPTSALDAAAAPDTSSGADAVGGAAAHVPGAGSLCTDTVPVSIPPCGFVPFQGQAALCAPLLYLAEDRVVAFELYRKMLVRYWCRLQSVESTERGSLLWLCVLFEALMRTHLPRVCEHMANTLRVQPLQFALPWIRLAFADFLMMEEVLVLWDRILAYDDLALLSVLAVAVFAFRRSEILHCHDRAELARIFLGGGMGGGVVNSSLKTVTLLSHFLFL